MNQFPSGENYGDKFAIDTTLLPEFFSATILASETSTIEVKQTTFCTRHGDLESLPATTAMSKQCKLKVSKVSCVSTRNRKIHGLGGVCPNPDVLRACNNNRMRSLCFGKYDIVVCDCDQKLRWHRFHLQFGSGPR